MSNPMEDTHLLNNGHIRCGIFRGHITQGFIGLWHPDIKLTANSESTTCPRCREAAVLPPIEVSQRLEVLVENIKIINKDKPAMERMADALSGTITLRDLLPYAKAVAEEMQSRPRE